MDVAAENGHQINAGKLADALGVPVQPVVASRGEGVQELTQRIISTLACKQTGAPAWDGPRQFYSLPAPFVREAAIIAALLTAHFQERRRQAAAEALLILSNEKALASSLEHYPASIQQAVDASRKRLEAAGVEWRSAAIEARYASVTAINESVVTQTRPQQETLSDRLDRVLTHKLW